MSPRFLGRLLLLCLGTLSLPSCAAAWGSNGHRMIANKAVDTLPPEIRPFYESMRRALVQEATLPIESLERNPTERKLHFILFEKYGRFPYENLPRNYKAAIAKFGRQKLEANGLLPWQIGVYSEKLTQAFKAGNWDEVRLNSALLAHYVAEAHDPFNTTDDFDGKLAGQPGVNLRFNTNLVDRFSLFFPMHPNDAFFINDPTDHAFDSCLSAHAWLENILLADRRSRAGLADYTDEYYDRFYNQAAAILIRQLSDAATDVGSFWLTAWVNAGRPALPTR
jgi:hypothetical protein